MNETHFFSQLCFVGEYDPDFSPEGYNEMTEMKKLNDCELARSLECKFRR